MWDEVTQAHISVPLYISSHVIIFKFKRKHFLNKKFLAFVLFLVPQQGWTKLYQRTILDGTAYDSSSTDKHWLVMLYRFSNEFSSHDFATNFQNCTLYHFKKSYTSHLHLFFLFLQQYSVVEWKLSRTCSQSSVNTFRERVSNVSNVFILSVSDPHRLCVLAL